MNTVYIINLKTNTMKQFTLTPQNDKQLVIMWLFEREHFSMKSLIQYDMFYKFPARLSEIEKRFGQIAKREKIEFTKRWGRKSYYYRYSQCVSNKQLSDIFNFYK